MCKIYYGTVVYSEDNHWNRWGAHIEEPVKVEGREPFGNSPEFCCKEFEESWHDYLIIFFPNFIRGQIDVRWIGSPYRCSTIHFCPFCGAEIILQEHLKLRAVKTTRIVESWYYEKEV